MAREVCDSCHGKCVVAVCDCHSVHVCEEQDYCEAWQDAWGVWWRKCDECKASGTIQVDDDQEVIV